MSQLDDLREEYFSHIDHCWESSEDFDTTPLVSKEEFDELIKQIKAEAWTEGECAGADNQAHWNGHWYDGGFEENTNPYKEYK